MFTGVGGFELGIRNIHRNRSSRPLHGGSEKSLLPRAESLPSPEEPPPTCVGVSEIDKYSCQVLRKRFPEVKNYGDATKINTDELPDFDMLVGGFPCQAFSIAGNRRGFDDTRGTLFFEVARILEAKKPLLVVLENVKGLLNHDKGKTFSVILNTLWELGYNVQWMVLNSKFFGVPQNRERVFIIGSLRGERRPEVLPFTIADGESVKEGVVHPTLTEALGRQGSSKEYIHSIQITNASKREVSWKDHAPTLQARGYKDPKIVSKGIKIRRLTPRECERLQAFPDDWTKKGIDEKGNEVTISDTQRYKMMGNAVTTKVVQSVMERLL